MEQLQADVTSLPARELWHLLAGAAGNSDDPAAQMLLRWNAVLDRESPAAALYELWQTEIEKQMLHHLAPENAWKTLQRNLSLTVILNSLEHPDQETFGAQPESARNQFLLHTLKTALDKFKSLHLSDPSY